MALNKVIKIPSSNIYDADNPKVINNLVDKIEVSVRKGEINHEYNKIVYSNDFENENIFNSSAIQDDQDLVYKNYIGTTTQDVMVAFSYVFVEPIYGLIRVNLEKKGLDFAVDNFNISKDDDGNPEIMYSLYGNKIEGQVSNSVVLESNDRKINATYDYSQNQYSEKSNKLGVYELSSNDLSISNEEIINEHLYPSSFNCKASIEFYNNETIADPTIIEENEEVLILEFSVLIGAKTFKIGVSNYSWTNGWNPVGAQTTVPISGEYTNYLPKKVSISVYGNTTELDLTEQIYKIGNGENTYSFSGNELTQTSNTPSIQSTYQSIIDKWKNGLEIATLQCSVDNYYYTGYIPKTIDFFITTIQQMGGASYYLLNIRANLEYVFEVGDVCSILGGNMLINGVASDEGDYTAILSNPSEVPYSGEGFIDVRIIGKYTSVEGVPAISKDGTDSLPMLFNIGDWVSPYVYGANGQDKPMSVYRDGNPKNFVVVGNKITYDGVVMQTITLQEQPEQED